MDSNGPNAMDHKARNLAQKLVALCEARKLMVATAESCTGGLVGAAITDIPGASVVFERGFITYSNAAKHELLGVSEELLKEYGAVSAPVARAMALGALRHARADLAVSITGVAGPGGGTAEKPIGLVHFAVAREAGGIEAVEKRFAPESREQIRAASVLQALEMLIAAAERG